MYTLAKGFSLSHKHNNLCSVNIANSRKRVGRKHVITGNIGQLSVECPINAHIAGRSHAAQGFPISPISAGVARLPLPAFDLLHRALGTRQPTVVSRLLLQLGAGVGYVTDAR